MWYAIAAIVVVLVGGVIWAVVRAARSERARAERDILRDGQKGERDARKSIKDRAAAMRDRLLARTRRDDL